MKNLLLPTLFLFTLAGCGSKNDDPQARTATDPFLGKWAAESQHDVYYTSTGQVSRDNTYTHAYRLDVTPTTYTESNYDNPNGTGTLNTSATRAYTRTGEHMVVDGAAASTTYELRGLSDTGFTYITTGQIAGSGAHVITMVYHR